MSRAAAASWSRSAATTRRAGATTRSSTAPAASSCPGWSRPTSTPARPSRAAAPTTSSCSTGCAPWCGRTRRRSTRRGSGARARAAAILDMATVHRTDAVFAAAERAGIRATIGKAMMDAPDPQIPAGLRESTRASLDESAALIARWHGAADGRLRYAYAPRFVLSCTDELLREVGEQARARGVRIHTHASENTGEIALVRQRFGKDNIVVLDEHDDVVLAE